MVYLSPPAMKAPLTARPLVQIPSAFVAGTTSGIRTLAKVLPALLAARKPTMIPPAFLLAKTLQALLAAKKPAKKPVKIPPAFLPAKVPVTTKPPKRLAKLHANINA